MATIYCIEDINGLKYVGSTIQVLKRRFKNHKLKTNNCTSRLLDLHNSKIYELEKCELSNKQEREKYWINNIDCVNYYKYNWDKNEEKKYMTNYYNKNSKNIKRHSLDLHYYKCSWGGDKRYHNNLLEIDVKLFNYG